jgi:hypothetical protein
VSSASAFFSFHLLTGKMGPRPSPFNVGSRVELNSFTHVQVALLMERHGLQPQPEHLEDLMRYLGGLPYLTHLLLYHWAHQPERRTQFFDASSAGGGLFKDHLHRYLFRFQQDEALAAAMRRVIAGKGCDDIRMTNRLEAAGLVRWNEAHHVVPLCELYAEFFGQTL